jgi:CRP-like cAMP-binding protein
MANLPNFDQAIDAISAHFRAVVVPDVARPRVEAERIREIASAHRMIATQVVEAANTRIERLIRASQTA